MSGLDYYDKILKVIRDYLGPASERFLNRQILTHLKKEPADLTRSDISSLAIRIRSGLLVLTHDEIVVEEAYQKIVEIID